MSKAKVFNLRDKILRRGWQLTELYNDVQNCYVTRISGLVADVGGETRLWNLQAVLDAAQLAGVLPAQDVWERHLTKMISEAEQYLKKAEAQVAAGEYLHDDRPVEASADASRPASDDQGAQHSRSGLLDALGNPIS